LPVLFTPGQIMAAFSLSKQQWRTYRQALLPLNPDSGRSPCFTAGDLLATAVVKHVSGSFGMPLSSFSPVASSLFSICGAHPWPQLERSYISLMLDEPHAVLVDIDHRQPPISLAILVKLRPLVLRLQETLLAPSADPQHDLPFPPMIAGGRQ
jgi:hypothetical protein